MSNYQPGNLEETQPYFPAQQSQPSMPPVDSGGRGCSLGCILWGCLGTSLAVLFVFGLMSFAFYRFYNNQIVKYTSESPLELPSAEISDEEVQAITQRFEDFGTQFDQGDAPQELVITVEEINALIASNKDLRGKVHVQIVDHNLRADLSIPTDAIPGGKGRYFNGSVTLHVELDQGILIVQVVDAEANGEPIPEMLMEGFRKENLAKELYKDVEMSKTLKRCEELTIESDRIILKVRPATKPVQEAGSDSPSTSQPTDTQPNKSEGSDVRAEIETNVGTDDQTPVGERAD